MQPARRLPLLSRSPDAGMPRLQPTDHNRRMLDHQCVLGDRCHGAIGGIGPLGGAGAAGTAEVLVGWPGLPPGHSLPAATSAARRVPNGSSSASGASSSGTAP